MAIEYNVIQKRVLGALDNKKKYYAITSTTGEVTLDDLTEEIEKNSTVSAADISAVLRALVDSLPHHLSDGKIVRFGRLGSFRITLSSEGENLEKDINAHSIKKSRIAFSPGKQLTDALKLLSYKKKHN